MGNGSRGVAPSADDYLNDPQTARWLDVLKRHWDEREPEVSNLVDAQGHQYVDLVMQGGGTLGIALVGYTYALESVGIRFKSIGGTSAGAINATLLAGLAPPHESKSRDVLEAVAAMDMASFLDSPRKHHKKLVLAIANKKSRARILWHGMLSFGRACRDLGLHPGDEFERWLEHQLYVAGVTSQADLLRRMETTPEGFRVEDPQPGQRSDFKGQLKMVAADLTTMTKVEFPKFAPLYFAKPDDINPARFVRASMSIPLVFFPMEVRGIPSDDDAHDRWSNWTSFEDAPPESVRFVDGGILSNFPISLFHPMKRGTPPRCPTFGVRLGPRRKSNSITTLQHLATKSFDTARSGADYDFLARNREYRHLVQRIDTGEINWLDFDMPRADRLALFRLGVEAATHFLLNRFDWRFYQCVRATVDGREPPEWCADVDVEMKESDGREKIPGPDHPTPAQMESLVRGNGIH